MPTTLVDLDELAALVVEHYERFDTEGGGLLPLVRVTGPPGRIEFDQGVLAARRLRVAYGAPRATHITSIMSCT